MIHPSHNYKESDKICEVISSEPSLLQMICRFGIQLGVGDRTIREVCEATGVDTTTFLAVANVMKHGRGVADFYVDKIDMPTMVNHLKAAHEFFLDFQLLHIRRKLLEAIDCSRQNEVAFLILKYYDEYMSEVRKHMEYENKKVFDHVDRLLTGKPLTDFRIKHYSMHHDAMESRLEELKNIIIKYYTPTEGSSSDLLSDVLLSIYNCEGDLRSHCDMEDALFFPAVEILEAKVEAEAVEPTEEPAEETPQEVLSEREKEIVACVVRGMTNKEVAAQLFISINTVLTHRKNISRKLDIHSVSGLTIYAIVNGIVKLDDITLQ